MYPRFYNYPKLKSFFLFGPRGTGKSSWAKTCFPTAQTFDLLRAETRQDLLANPSRLEQMIKTDTVILDEIQKVPALLDEVHRLIEEKKVQFILTGSSARKLKTSGANLLAGRARRIDMGPLTAHELGDDFNLLKSLKVGHLPEAYLSDDPKDYLRAYVATYLREEIERESEIRRLDRFASFLELAAFSQAQVLSVNRIAQECGVDQKTAQNYFSILKDLLIGFELSVFKKKSKRKPVSHSKFYYFDVGVFRSLWRPGPLDDPGMLMGVCLETLVLQEIRTTVSQSQIGLDLFYWRTTTKNEVDFVLYGEDGFFAIEVKTSSRIRSEDLKDLKIFQELFPKAKCYFVYGGEEERQIDGIHAIGAEKFLRDLPRILLGSKFNAR
jgi:predicted AAA+ superfamily ATPase